MSELQRIFQTLATLGSGMAAQPIAGLAGMTRLDNPEEAARIVQALQEKLTYQPQNKQSLSDLAKISEIMQWVSENTSGRLGNAALQATGSPAAATAAHMVPDIALSVLPFLKGAGGAPVAGARAFGDLEGGAIRLGPKEVSEIVKRAKEGGGATIDIATGKGIVKGDKHAPGYAVATRGPTGKGFEDVGTELTNDRLSAYVNRKDVAAALKKPGAKLGVWQDDGKWYFDVSETLPEKFSAANATINRGEKAAWNTASNPASGSSYVSDPFPTFRNERQARATYNAEVAGLPEEAARKTELLKNEPRPKVPDEEGFWPWRVDRGEYELRYNDPKGGRGEGHYSVNRVQSEGERKLSDMIKQAEDDIASGKIETLFRDADVYDQPDRNVELPVPYAKKGKPAWIDRDLTPEAKEKLIAAYERGKAKYPLSPKWYGMGRLYDDLLKEYGGDVARTEAAMDRLGDYMGTTTASSTPPQNLRTASFHGYRAKQGLPVPEVVQYPYGHMYSGTHNNAMRGLEELGYIDSMANPKGAHFSGNISGKTPDATLDKVMSNNIPFRNAGGKVQDAPPYYGYPRDWVREIAAELGVKPKEVQAGAWVDFNEVGNKPLMQVLGDRIAVTSAVTGIPQKIIYKLWQKNWDKKKRGGIPLLSTLPLSALVPDEDSQAP